MENLNNRVAVYLRVSTDRQDVQSQELMINRYLTGRAIEVPPDRHFHDECSGGTMQRPGLAKLQQAIFAGEVDTVVFYALDRFARTMLDGLLEVQKWQQLGVRMIFVQDAMEIDPRSWMGDVMLKLLVAIKCAMAEGEKQKIHARMKAGVQAAKDEAEEARKMFAGGSSVLEISRTFRRPQVQIQKMLNAKPGAIWWGGRKKDNCELKGKTPRIIELIAAGHTEPEICRILGIGRITLWRRTNPLGGLLAIRERLKADAIRQQSGV